MHSRQTTRIVENAIITASNSALQNDSARLCWNDAITQMHKGQGEYAIRRSLRAIAHGFGRLHPDYRHVESELNRYLGLVKEN